MKTNYLINIRECVNDYLSNCNSLWYSSIASITTKEKIKSIIQELDFIIETIKNANELLKMIEEYNNYRKIIYDAKIKLANPQVEISTKHNSIRKKSLMLPLLELNSTVEDAQTKQIAIKNKILSYSNSLFENINTVKHNNSKNVPHENNICITLKPNELVNATKNLSSDINNYNNDVNLSYLNDIFIPHDLGLNLKMNLNMLSINIRIRILNCITDLNNICKNIILYISKITNNEEVFDPIKYNDFKSQDFNYTETPLNINDAEKDPTKEDINKVNNQIYTVQTGDTLSKIAQKYYGDSNKYNLIYEANKNILTQGANIIYTGQQLIIPNIVNSKLETTINNSTTQTKIDDSSSTNEVNEKNNNIKENVTNINNSTSSMLIPEDIETNFKSYTKYTAVSSQKNADGNYIYKQAAILYGDAPDLDGNSYNAYTDSETHVRCVNINGEKYYCAAMGNYYGNVGDTLTINTDEGNTFNVIICDAKGMDTTSYNIDGKVVGHKHSNNNMSIVEFYYDPNLGLPDEMLVRNGTTGTFNSVPKFSGNISSILKTSMNNNNQNAI